MISDAKVKRSPNARVLAALNEGLEEIENYFGWNNPDTLNAPVRTQPLVTQPKAGQSGTAHQNEEEDNLEEEYDLFNDELESEGGYFDREEVEIALDAFISSLIESGIIKMSGQSKMPNFADVFNRFFGVNEQIVKLAKEFEKKIDGYMGWIGPDEMQSAKAKFSEIRSTVRNLIEAQSHA